MRPENVTLGRVKETPAQRADRTSRTASDERSSGTVQCVDTGVPLDPLVENTSGRRGRAWGSRSRSG